MRSISVARTSQTCACVIGRRRPPCNQTTGVSGGMPRSVPCPGASHWAPRARIWTKDGAHADSHEEANFEDLETACGTSFRPNQSADLSERYSGWVDSRRAFYFSCDYLDLGDSVPDLTEPRPTLVESGPNLAAIGRSRAQSGPNRTSTCRIRPNSAQIWLISAQHLPNSAQDRATSPQLCPVPDRKWSTLGRPRLGDPRDSFCKNNGVDPPRRFPTECCAPKAPERLSCGGEPRTRRFAFALGELLLAGGRPGLLAGDLVRWRADEEPTLGDRCHRTSRWAVRRASGACATKFQACVRLRPVSAIAHTFPCVHDGLS